MAGNDELNACILQILGVEWALECYGVCELNLILSCVTTATGLTTVQWYRNEKFLQQSFTTNSQYWKLSQLIIVLKMYPVALDLQNLRVWPTTIWVH